MLNNNSKTFEQIKIELEKLVNQQNETQTRFSEAEKAFQEAQKNRDNLAAELVAIAKQLENLEAEKQKAENRERLQEIIAQLKEWGQPIVDEAYPLAFNSTPPTEPTPPKDNPFKKRSILDKETTDGQATEKKLETASAKQSQQSPVAVAADKKWLDVDGYSFLVNLPNRTFEFYPANSENRFEGLWNSEQPAAIGLRTGERKLFVSSAHVNEWLPEWDQHLFVIETALQKMLENPRFKVKFPPRSQQEKPVPYRDNGLISLPANTLEFKAVQKCNGFTVSYKEGKDFQLSGKSYTGITLKVLGQGTTASGIEVNCSFATNES